MKFSISPHQHTHHEEAVTTTQIEPTDEGNDQISPEVSDRSAIERAAAHDITTSGRRILQRERKRERKVCVPLM